MSIRTNAVILVALCGTLAGQAAAQTDLLPDIYVEPSYLYDNQITFEGGTKYLRLSNGTANIGLGKLYLRGGEINGDGTRTVHQRIFRDDGTTWEREAGRFVHHGNHGHMHFDNWAAYRLREIVGQDGVGDVIAEGIKTSFCLIDLAVYDSGLPNFNPNGEFFSCNSIIQGLSVGWVDIYSKGLSGQVIPIDGVPDGEYWLESEVDPENSVLESNEGNNISRVRINLGGGGGLDPDRFEPNDSRTETAGRAEGAPNSPNFGPCNPQRVEGVLTIHDGTDDDYFRFYVNSTGTSQDFVRINFLHNQGDLDMELFDENGQQIGISNGTSNSETISLNGVGRGYYSVRVYGYNGATSPSYTLTIDPPANQAPTVVLTTPPTGDTIIEQGEESYRVEWNASDPENNDTWVTIYANDHPDFDGHEILMPTSVHTPGDQGFYIINSAYLDEGTYYILAEITDGGTTTWAASPGTLTLVNFCDGDFNRDGNVDTQDVLDFLNAWAAGDPEADTNGDGEVDTLDVLVFLNTWTAGC